jgi:DNA-binding MarR family transcriptional regulator
MSSSHLNPDGFFGRDGLGNLLRRVYLALLERLTPIIGARGLTVTQWLVLTHLRSDQLTPVGTLRDELRHDSGALTRVIDQLEGGGLVQRERSRSDRRSVLLQLTDTGRGVVEALAPEVASRVTAALAELPQSAGVELVRLLRGLVEILEGRDARLKDRSLTGQELAAFGMTTSVEDEGRRGSHEPNVRKTCSRCWQFSQDLF